MNSRGKELDLIAYEGGQHLTVTKISDYGNLSDVYKEASFHPEMKNIYKKYLEGWKESGGGLFVHYKLIDGFWGLYTDMDDLGSSKYEAVKEFMNENPKWWD